MRRSICWLALVVAALLLAACSVPRLPDGAADPLPGWHDTAAKAQLLQFVQAVTTPGSPDFVPVAERVAVFDHDGTLVVERPYPIQFDFIFARIRSLADEHPDWAGTEPFSDVLDGNAGAVAAAGFRSMSPLIDAAQAGISEDAFAEAAREFLKDARHIERDKKLTELAYAPMLELMAVLAANDFDVYIVTGGGTSFVRALAGPVYGLPHANVIGSVQKSALSTLDGASVVLRKPGFASLNVGPFKVLNIQRHIGRRPIFAAGNSDSDLPMLQYTSDSNRRALAVVVRHDDADREYAYTDGAERIERRAADAGWLVVSMREDFARVLPE